MVPEFIGYVCPGWTCPYKICPYVMLLLFHSLWWNTSREAQQVALTKIWNLWKQFHAFCIILVMIMMLLICVREWKKYIEAKKLCCERLRNILFSYFLCRGQYLFVSILIWHARECIRCAQIVSVRWENVSGTVSQLFPMLFCKFHPVLIKTTYPTTLLSDPFHCQTLSHMFLYRLLRIRVWNAILTRFWTRRKG